MTLTRFYNLGAAFGWFTVPFSLNYLFGPFHPVVMLILVILSVFAIDLCIRDFINNKF